MIARGHELFTLDRIQQAHAGQAQIISSPLLFRTSNGAFFTIANALP